MCAPTPYRPFESARESPRPPSAAGRRRSKSSLESLRPRYRAGEADLKSGPPSVGRPHPRCKPGPPSAGVRRTSQVPMTDGEDTVLLSCLIALGARSLTMPCEPTRAPPAPHRARRPAPFARRDHDRLRRLGHAAALRQRARRAPRRPHPRRALRPLPHGRDHRHRAAGRASCWTTRWSATSSRSAVGRARYTMICRRGRRHPGRPDRLPARPTSEYMVVANASNAQVVLDALTERAAGFDAEVRDDRDAYALIAVQGPQSPGILEVADRRRPGRAEVLRGPARHRRRRARADRPHRLHRRGRLRAVRRPGRRRAAVAGADRGGRGRRAWCPAGCPAATRCAWRRACRCTGTS